MEETRFPDWQELVVTIDIARQEEVLARLDGLGYDQCWLEQPIEHLRTPDGWEPGLRDPEHALVHVYCHLEQTDAAARLAEHLGDLALSVTASRLATADWLEQWRQGRQVVELANGWTICPPWLADQAPDQQRAIIIDPGLAFGAGDHVTTQDCGRLLVRLVRPGDRVLDLGAGSGVLSILALKLGAESALAVEIDAMAAAEVARNGALNGVANLLVSEADATATPLNGTYDLIVANIGAAELRRSAGTCTALARPGTRLILSGLVDWAADGVADVYLALGWTLAERVQGSSEWVTLSLLRS